MIISKYYEIITNNKNFEKKIYRKSNFKLISIGLIALSTILFIFTIGQSIIWSLFNINRQNVVGLINLFIYFISIILLVFIDEIKPLKGIPKYKDQFFVLIYIIQRKIDSINENKLLNLETICFFDMINLATRYLYRMESYYDNIFLSEGRAEQKLVISNLRIILSKNLNKLLNNKKEFKHLLDLYIETYKYEIEDEKIPEDTYKKINEYISTLYDLPNKISSDMPIINKIKDNISINVIKWTKMSAILILVIGGIYFTILVSKNPSGSVLVTNLYTVIGTTVCLIFSIATNKSK